jgi:hypothetical protein
MSTRNGVQEPVGLQSSEPVRPEQMVLLRKLADQCRETFAYPQTEVEAEVEIARLEGRPVGEGLDMWLDRAQVRRDVSRSGRNAASVRDSEIVGYGSSAHWKVSGR